MGRGIVSFDSENVSLLPLKILGLVYYMQQFYIRFDLSVHVFSRSPLSSVLLNEYANYQVLLQMILSLGLRLPHFIRFIFLNIIEFSFRKWNCWVRIVKLYLSQYHFLNNNSSVNGFFVEIVDKWKNCVELCL